MSHLTPENNILQLEPDVTKINEVVIRSHDPVLILKGAMQNIDKNYRTQPSMVTGFYRETIKQNRSYVSIAEAVLEAYKASYINSFTDDKVKIKIGRKSADVKKMDTVMFKFQGGTVTPFMLDVVKHPDELFSDDYYNFYEYKLTGQITFNNTLCFVIEFKQKTNTDQALYDGKVYIESESLAIAGIEFNLSPTGLPLANKVLIKKKPLTMKIEITKAGYLVKYVKINNLWHLNYVRSELNLKCKWNKKLFKSNFSIVSEMAVTNTDTVNVTRFKYKDSEKPTDIFSDKAEDFRNDEFWGDYNIIKPDESIQNAIEKLNKRNKAK